MSNSNEYYNAGYDDGYNGYEYSFFNEEYDEGYQAGRETAISNGDLDENE